MSAFAEALDHVGIGGPDLAALARAWERLGFTLTPQARHSGRPAPDAPVVPFATANRCIMLEHGYLELIAVVDPAAPGDMIGRYLERGPGVHILALAIDDPAANLDRLRAAGLPIGGVAYLERTLSDAAPDGQRVRFARLPLPDAPEAHVMLIQQLTPEAMWQPHLMRHANNATGLEAVSMTVPDPAASAARFARLAGRRLRPIPDGGFALDLPRGSVRLLPGDRPWMSELTLRTSDATLGVQARLSRSQVPFAVTPDGVRVLPDHTGGVALRFIT